MDKDPHDLTCICREQQCNVDFKCEYCCDWSFECWTRVQSYYTFFFVEQKEKEKKREGATFKSFNIATGISFQVSVPQYQTLRVSVSQNLVLVVYRIFICHQIWFGHIVTYLLL